MLAPWILDCEYDIHSRDVLCGKQNSLIIGITVIHMEASKQQSAEHIIKNQPRQQTQFDDSCYPLGCCFSPQANSSFRVPEVASGSCCHCHCRSTIMK